MLEIVEIFCFPRVAMRAIIMYMGFGGIQAELLQQLLAQCESGREEPQSTLQIKLAISEPDEELLNDRLQNAPSSHRITDHTLVRDMTPHCGSIIRAKRSRSMCRRGGYHF